MATLVRAAPDEVPVLPASRAMSYFLTPAIIACGRSAAVLLAVGWQRHVIEAEIDEAEQIALQREERF